ncbi:MAG: ABC transporter permease [Thermoplasmata archaeon]
MTSALRHAPGTPPRPATVRDVARKVALFTHLRGWKVWSSYRAQVALTIVGWLVPVFLFFVLAGFLGTTGSSIEALDGGSYVDFFVIGLAFQGFVSNLVGLLAQRIRNEQMMGTLELIFLSPTSPGGILVYSSIFGLILNLIAAAVILGVGVGLLGVHLTVSLGPAIVATVLLAISSTGLGLIAAAFILWTKQGNPVAIFFSTFTQFFAGVLFPVSALPAGIRWLAYTVPLTFGLNALRPALLAGASFASIAPDLGWMAVYAAVTVPLGLWLFGRTLRITKREGTVATY